MKTLHTSQHYTAHLLNNSSLIVEAKRRRGGVQLMSSHPQFIDYVEALETAIDSTEADSLCKALLN